MCPFAKITVRSEDFQRFTRISLKLYCRNRLTTEYATKLNQVDSSLFWTENIKVGSDPLKNCQWEDSSYDNHRLPEEISLGLGVCYPLEIIAYFDHPDFAGEWTIAAKACFWVHASACVNALLFRFSRSD